MPSGLRFLLAGLPLALAACVDLEPNTKPQSIERGVRTADRNSQCDLGDYKVYRPTPEGRGAFDRKGEKAPYDAVIPPTYDAPSQLPSYCSDKLGE